jgi:hypothetical protein
MAHIAIKLLTSLKSQDQKQRKLNSYKLKPKSKQKLKFSVIKQMISKRFSRKFNNGVKNIRMLKTFRMKLFQKITISEISKGMISLVKLEIKAVVGHAILYLSLKLLNLDLKWNMEKRFHKWVHNNWCNVTIWMKVAMEDGLSFTDIWLKTVLWLQKSALHIKQRLKDFHVLNTRIATLLRKLRKVTSLEVLTENLAKKRWWRKFWETVLLTENLMFQEFSLIIKRVFFQMTMKPKCPVISNTAEWLLITNKLNNSSELTLRRNPEAASPIEIWRTTV